MKNLLLIIIVLFCFACNQSSPVKKEGRYAELLKLYKDVKIDTLRIFTQEKLDSAGYEFKGFKMDTAFTSLFPKELLQDTAAHFYAVYKFNLDATRIGLITRTPSQYESSSVKLLIYDKTADAITDYIELSELFGDAGDDFVKTSWLYDDVSKGIKCFTSEEFTHDNSIDNEKDTTVIAEHHYYIIGFKNAKHDTIIMDAADRYPVFKNKE